MGGEDPAEETARVQPEASSVEQTRRQRAAERVARYDAQRTAQLEGASDGGRHEARSAVSGDDGPGRTAQHGGHASAPKRRGNPITRLVNQWFDRVMGAINDGGLSGQEAQYASHRTTRDFIWNTVGVGAWGMVFPILTMIATQLVGVESAGMLSMAFVVGSLLWIVANFGVRTYQISDVNEAHSFADYQVNRWITCVLMVVIGCAYCAIRGYDSEMFYLSVGISDVNEAHSFADYQVNRWITCVLMVVIGCAYCAIRGYDSEMFYLSVGIFLYRMVDGLADVYEGRLQQVDKLYLAGISQALRSVLALVVFAILLVITRNMVVAAFGMAIAAAATFVVVTYPLTLLETPKSRKVSWASVGQLFKNTAPLFVALFLYALIDNMPKFVMEGALSYDNQLYFNALYFPAQGILITSQLVYKPLLVRMAGVWQDASKRRQFDLIMVGILGVIVAVTAVNVLIMGWIGIPIMGFLYGIDFEQFRGLMYIMLAAGGVTAAIDFMYQVITVMRRQKDVTTLYLVTFGFSLFVPILLVMFTGLPGAVIGYLIVMTLLFVLLVWEYFRIRKDMAHEAQLRQAREGAAE